MKKSEPVSIVIVSDDHLVVMLSVLLKSLEKSHKGNRNINIYIVNDGIKPNNKKKVSATVSSSNILIFWVDINSVIPNKSVLPIDGTSYPSCIYARLFIPNFLPESIKKVIYLDVDMLVLEDIEKLWETEMGNRALAAVTDLNKIVSSPWGIVNYRELGMSQDSLYFNSGVLLIDLFRWRQMGATSSILETININKDNVVYPDQYGLNVVFYNNWLELDPKWNSFAQFQCEEPYAIHFTGVKPIFEGYRSNASYAEIFYTILSETPWKSYIPRKNYLWKFKRVKNLVKRKAWRTLLGKSWNLVSSSFRPS